MFDQFKDEVLSKHYKDGIQYQQSMGFTKNWAEYERFLNECEKMDNKNIK